MIPFRPVAAVILALGIGGTMSLASEPDSAKEPDWANRYDRKRAEILERRAADWRNGALVYQVFVDRFAPSEHLESKRDLYPPPKRLRAWTESPQRGTLLEEVGVWSHEIDFWGGDLQSLQSKLDYIENLGMDVVYLNPIHKAYTNHKYDAQDYFAVSEEYGTRDDVKALAGALHERGMRLVLDGVFNHMGRTAPIFQEALSDEKSPYRAWFFFGGENALGYRGWADVANLPELRLENPQVRARLFGDPDSVVQGYLRDGVDGWRLDVAPELGFVYLSALTQSAHEAKADSLVVGENWVYPEEWMPALDAVMNLYYLRVMDYMLSGDVSGAHAGRLIDRVIADTGLEPLLKSWIILDNHDLPRIKTRWPLKWRQRIAQVLQFTLPGSPCVYYGAELGMEGGEDPQQRGPMRWDLVRDDNPDLEWMRQLIALRRGNRALRIGDFRLLDSQHVLAFMRRTDRVAETTVVVVNPTDRKLTDVVPIRESKLMSWSRLVDVLGEAEVRVEKGILKLEVPARTAWVLQLAPVEEGGAYDPHKRMR